MLSKPLSEIEFFFKNIEYYESKTIIPFIFNYSPFFINNLDIVINREPSMKDYISLYNRGIFIL